MHCLKISKWPFTFKTSATALLAAERRNTEPAVHFDGSHAVGNFTSFTKHNVSILMASSTEQIRM